MTQEDYYSRYNHELQSGNASDEDDVVTRLSVKEMVRHFDRASIYNSGGSRESLEKCKDPAFDSLTSVVNPIHSHFQNLCLVAKSQDRNSNVSVNSILSNASENSCESGSSGFISDRKSGSGLAPHRPAPAPPNQFKDNDSPESKSPISEEVTLRERKFSFNTPCSSPVVTRRSRQPPVIRRKSNSGNQGHVGERHWSYGVTQSALERLLRLKRSDPSDNEEEKLVPVEDSTITKGDDSSDTLINEDESSDSNDVGDDASIESGESDGRSNYDNISIKSISSFDMVPYQKYDSITVSSDEFGSEVCHAPDTEFLTVSAVNEWCISKSKEPVLLAVESKKEKYRRRLTDLVNELIHTETAYVERLRHVVEDYIPHMNQPYLTPTFRAMKPEIFGNIEKIYRFHSEEFLPELRDSENDLRKLGQCFRIFEKRFNMYVMYSRNNKRATRLVFEHRPFFKGIAEEYGDKLDLSSYLLDPVQRIPRYKLFFEHLVKTYTAYDNERCESDSRISKLSVDSDETGGSNGESSESDETPLESLKAAKTMIECVLTAIDEIMALENITNCPLHLNLLNQGRFLRQHEFSVTDGARRRRYNMRVFLFDKLVLFTVVPRQQSPAEHFIYKDHISVHELGITPKEENQHEFIIWYKKRDLKSYTLETKDPNVKNAWLEDINALLWEQARKEKELIQQKLNKRTSMVSMNSEDSTQSESNDDKYNSLRGVPGEVKRIGDKKVRRTTWYCE